MSVQAAAAAVVPYLGDSADAVTLVALAGVESSWTLDCAGDCLGGAGSYNGPPSCRYTGTACGPTGHTGLLCASWGPWQVNLPAHAARLQALTGSADPCAWAAYLTGSWAQAARVAVDLYRAYGFAPWGPDLTSGRVNRYRAAAQAAVAAAGQAPPTRQGGTATPPATTAAAPKLVLAGGFGALLAAVLVVGGVAYLARG